MDYEQLKFQKDDYVQVIEPGSERDGCVGKVSTMTSDSNNDDPSWVMYSVLFVFDPDMTGPTINRYIDYFYDEHLRKLDDEEIAYWALLGYIK